MADSKTPSITSPIYNVQHILHTSKPKIYPSLPYTAESLKIINKINFQFSDRSDTDILHFAIYYLNTKHAMQHIEMMLAKSQLRSVLDSNLMLNVLHNVLLRY